MLRCSDNVDLCQKLSEKYQMQAFFNEFKRGLSLCFRAPIWNSSFPSGSKSSVNPANPIAFCSSSYIIHTRELLTNVRWDVVIPLRMQLAGTYFLVQPPFSPRTHTAGAGARLQYRWILIHDPRHLYRTECSQSNPWAPLSFMAPTDPPVAL